MNFNNCYHCGLDCGSKPILFDEKDFCCNGCQTVYEILSANDLNDYYDLNSTPGSIPPELEGKYDYLDNKDIIDKLLSFNDGERAVVELHIPAIHCSSCIWVLENLTKLAQGITSSQVNFPKKTLRITYKNKETSLRSIVRLISSIGYEPYLSLATTEAAGNQVDKTLIYQISVAAFSFGNIMLLSFPEYFEVDEFWLERYKYLFRWLMFVMAVPVVFYSARDYFVSAYKGLKHRYLTIDVPIALGVSVLFLRSSIEIILDIGTGFFDSLTGLIFFLLLGKFFQQKTYNFLSFERDYKSYFPIAVTKILATEEKSIPVSEVVKGDRLLIRNQELIPVDGVLISGTAALDYSFVTGESLPVVKQSGDKLFAGGKQTAGAIEMEVINSISQSYLTQLWSSEVFSKGKKGIRHITDAISKYFTLVILCIALLAGIYWYLVTPSMVVNVVTAVLIIACPCALALSAPFAFGNMLRIFGYQKYYLKNAETLESMAGIDTIIFDKTGTITTNEQTRIHYRGAALSSDEQRAIKTVLRASNHPLSRSLYAVIDQPPLSNAPERFEEVLGSGIEALVAGLSLQLGAAAYTKSGSSNPHETAIHIRIDGVYKGAYVFNNSYRAYTKEVFESLADKYDLVILSGDNEGEKAFLEDLLPPKTAFAFHQKPADKLAYIKRLQEQGSRVMMIGDGLNDAGALAQSDVGIAIAENVNVFSPACDAILDASLFEKLPLFMLLSRQTISIIKLSFVLSFLYNLVGMYFALTGQLTPVIAAILMPLSSISIVVFVSMLTNLIARKLSRGQSR